MLRVGRLAVGGRLGCHVQQAVRGSPPKLPKLPPLSGSQLSGFRTEYHTAMCMAGRGQSMCVRYGEEMRETGQRRWASMYETEQCKKMLQFAYPTSYKPKITASVIADLKDNAEEHDRAIEAVATAGDISEQVELRKRAAELSDFADAYRSLEHALVELKETHVLLMEMEKEEKGGEESPELKEVREMELQAVESLKEQEWNALRIMIRLKEAQERGGGKEADLGGRNVILEVRAGTGGAEAALFGVELMTMYQNFADAQGWTFEMLTTAETDGGGYREATASLASSDGGVYEMLRFEQGVHRVQRVPVTESLGRVHTSTVTVAVLPEAEDVDVELNPQDIKIDVYRASGAGGQHINTTESAVRVTHAPTGIVVAIQDERSQHKNKEKALKLLRARIYEGERARMEEARSKMRMGQIGTGGRSERIRTYNYPQGRITDHRSNVSLFDLEKMIGGDYLEEIVEGLQELEEAQRIEALLAA